MSLHPPHLKSEVGVRELHDHLSRYVRHVEAGEHVVVTMRGRRVARLSPLEREDPLADLRARGLIRDPEHPRRRAADHGRLRASGSVSGLVAEQRR